MPNFLGLACPRCGNTAKIEIASHLWLRVTAAGTEPDFKGDYEYTPHSPAICTGCGFVGTLRGIAAKPEGGTS